MARTTPNCPKCGSYHLQQNARTMQPYCLCGWKPGEIEPVPVSDLVSPWMPMSEPIDLKHMGKLGEEAGELCQVVCRCVIQGIDETDPTKIITNRAWLENEIADVQANIDLVVEHFKLDKATMQARTARKKINLKKWHSGLNREELK
jgi:hypothetical protein